jgi:hypothetical protein
MSDEKIARSRQRVALLFVAYCIVSVAIPVVIVAFAMPSEVSISHMNLRGFFGGAIALGIKIYFLSGVLPFAVWGARGFKAANARSLFIPWAILMLLAFVMPISGAAVAIIGWFVR